MFIQGFRLAGETLQNVLQMVDYIFADRLAGEPLLPWVLVPQLDHQGEEARVCVVQVKPGDMACMAHEYRRGKGCLLKSCHVRDRGDDIAGTVYRALLSIYVIPFGYYTKLPPKRLLNHHGRGGGGCKEDRGEVHHGGEVLLLLLLIVCW